MSILEISNLSKRFGGLQAVDRISFAVDRGEILGLIGPNGSGKSTTLSLAMGTVSPDSGSIKLQGREMANSPPHVISKHGMAMVFQHSRPLHRQTILENIRLALLPDKIFQLFLGHQIDEKVRQVARRVGLEKVLDKRPDSLPFAYLRRLELAKAIASNPPVLLLDEPFAGLAASETREFSDLIMSLRESGHAIVLVDHNVKAVAELVDRIVAMHAGHKIAEGTADEVTRDERVREVYFGESLNTTVSTGEPRGDTHGGQRLLSVSIESMRYGQAEALRDINIHVDEGEFISIVGLNGAGKTTLFNAILGFVNYDGDINWDGQSLHGKRSAAIATAGIALCAETRELFTGMTVRENLVLGGHALDSNQRHEQIERVLELFPVLGQRSKQAAFTLSGGEQQMLTIGRALMQKPRMLLLDEPTLGLAPLVNEHISDALDRLQQEMGLTVLLAEQNLTFALKHASRIYLLETGSVRWSGAANRFVEEVGESVL